MLYEVITDAQHLVDPYAPLVASVVAARAADRPGQTLRCHKAVADEYLPLLGGDRFERPALGADTPPQPLCDDQYERGGEDAGVDSQVEEAVNVV